MEIGHPASGMGAALRLEVERQLLADLQRYRPESSAMLKVDWSNPCQEGHCTHVLDGMLESMSDVVVRDETGTAVAEGWLDFVHGGDKMPLHVFWLFLDVIIGDQRMDAKSDPNIPNHIWERLSDASRAAIAMDGRYDGKWARDPKVIAWRQSK